MPTAVDPQPTLASGSHSKPHHDMSPHRRRSRRPDPFLSLPPLPSNDASPERTAAGDGSGEEEESLLARALHVFVSPILFLSFLLSLVLVSRRNRAYRVSQHPFISSPASRSSAGSSDSSTSSSAALARNAPPRTQRAWFRGIPSPPLALRHWIDPEPYRSSSHSAVATSVGPGSPTRSSRDRPGDPGARSDSWHIHRKVGKLARLELAEAFELRHRVIAGIAVLGVVALWGAVLLLRRALGWWCVQ